MDYFNDSKLKTYMDKLSRLINREATLVFLGKNFVNKARVDDILCCMEASFTEEYKSCLRKNRKKLKSYAYYSEIMNMIKRPFFLIPSLYVFSVGPVNGMLQAFLKSYQSDLKLIANGDL